MSPVCPRRMAAVVAVSLLIACGGGDSNPSGPDDNPAGPGLPDTPNPASVAVTLETSRATAARVTTGGGTVQATGSDGTIYTLTVPPDAVLLDTTITLVPLAGVSGLDLSGGRFVSVQLEPDGLQLFQPATLRISPPEGERHSAVAFTYHASGAEVYRAPMTPDPDRLEMSLLHFSGDVVYVGDGISIPAPVLNITPTEWADRIQSAIESYLRQERERVLAGEEPDPDLGANLAKAMRLYYDHVVGPSLDRMMTDCSFAHTAIPRAFGWERQVELLGLGDQFSAEESKVMSATVAAMENCFRQTVGNCLDRNNAEQMRTAILYSRQLQLLGVTDEQYNAFNEDLYCSGGWVGTTTRTRDVYGTGSSEIITGNVEWELNPDKSGGDVSYYRIKSGSIEWRLQGTDTNGCTVEGGPETFQLVPSEGELVLDGTAQVYYGGGATTHFTRVSVTCPAPQQSYTADWSVGDWLSIPPTPLPTDANQLAGRFEFQGLDLVYEWSFNR